MTCVTSITTSAYQTYENSRFLSNPWKDNLGRIRISIPGLQNVNPGFPYLVCKKTSILFCPILKVGLLYKEWICTRESEFIPYREDFFSEEAWRTIKQREVTKIASFGGNSEQSTKAQLFKTNYIHRS